HRRGPDENPRPDPRLNRNDGGVSEVVQTCKLAVAILVVSKDRREEAPRKEFGNHVVTLVAAAVWVLALSEGAADAEEPAADVSRVTSAAQGQILLLGTEVDPTTLTPARKKALLAAQKLIMVRTEFLAVEAKAEEVQRGPVFKG